MDGKLAQTRVNSERFCLLTTGKPRAQPWMIRPVSNSFIGAFHASQGTPAKLEVRGPTVGTPSAFIDQPEISLKTLGGMVGDHHRRLGSRFGALTSVHRRPRYGVTCNKLSRYVHLAHCSRGDLRHRRDTEMAALPPTGITR